MRKIEFRGKCRDTGDWIYGSHVKTAVGLHYIIPQNLISSDLPMYVVDSETVGQYTGLEDAHGKEIYEGDILRYHLEEYPGGHYREREETRRVEFSDCCFWLFSEKGDDPLYAVHAEDCELEIIGNRFENPELLEVAS